MLIDEVEGHLLIEAARGEGRAAAARGTAHLDWLADGQRMVFEREFVDAHLALCRLSWQRTVSRARELRAEGEEMYRRPRRQLIAGSLGCVTLVVTISSMLTGAWSGRS